MTTDDLRGQALDRIRRRRNFWTHAVIHTILCVVLILIWATSEYNNAGGWPTGFRTGRENRDWDPWIIYPLIALNLILAAHAWIAFGRRPPTEADVRREIERIERRP
jgi:2TM domain